MLFVASGVSIAFLIFQLIFPFKNPGNIDFVKIERNKKRYNRLEAWSILCVFVSVGVITLCVYIFGKELTNTWFPTEYKYIIQPTNMYWLFPGIVLGFGLIRIPMTLVYKLFLWDEYNSYMHFTNMKHGFDGEKIWKPIEKVITIVGVVLFMLGLNWYVRLNDNKKIEIDELYSIKNRVYELSEINKIYSYETKYEDRANFIHYFEIEMNDGYLFSTKIYSFFASDNDRIIIKEKVYHLSEITGIDIIRLDKNSKQ